MGRAIDTDKRLEALEHKINEVLLILDELGKTGSKQKKVDLNETTKQEKTNSKTAGNSNKQSNNGSSKKSDRDNKNSKNS
tara:strand:- start:731 stop:970 length:240 start_codon:yes stop_codon:yes gene_type:complete